MSRPVNLALLVALAPLLGAAGEACAAGPGPLETADGSAADAGLASDGGLTEVVVSARRRDERAQDVPVALSIVDSATLEATGSFNVNKLQQLQPTLQFYSSNPRNTSVNIRGIGAPFGLTNDGIEQGVGIYIDEVFYARVAASTFDFLDVAQIETLRGPQGTLYGKNTTSGALNITTRAPSFEPEGRAELSYGKLGYLQAKGAISGPLSASVAGRLVGSYTRRDGTLYNVTTARPVNGQENLGLRGQLLIQPGNDWDITLAADYNKQDPECCAQLYVRVAPTQRALNRRYANLAALSNYSPASLNPFDRLVDADTPLQARQTFGGASARIEHDFEGAHFTAITAWRQWDWQPSNDRDFTGLPITTVSANPSKQSQWTQEFRLASTGERKVDYTVGLFGFRQTIHSTGLQQQGASASLWLLGPTAGANPALLNGLKQVTDIQYTNRSAALFGRLGWHVTDAVTLESGLRVNYDAKAADYNAVASGGLATVDPVLIARKNSILQSQAYAADFSDTNVSGDFNASWKLAEDFLLYGVYAKTFKSGGVNLSGIPARADGTPATEVATVKPEDVNHVELGVKSQWLDHKVTLNLAAFRTEIRDYQATVVNGAVGVLRGYLANAEKVRTQGFEADFTVRPVEGLRLTLAGAYTDAKYVKFVDAPPPLELSGGTVQVVDISGQRLPGVSRLALSYGAEYSTPVTLFGNGGEVFAGWDGNYRSKWSSSPSPSAYLDVAGYALNNLRLGFRTDKDWEVSLWARNAFDRNYFDFLTAQSGSTGLVVGQPGDPRTFGLTFKAQF